MTNYDSKISSNNGPVSQGQRAPTEPQFQEMFQNFMKTMISPRMEKAEGQPQASSPPHFSGSQSQGELDKPYGMPAITALPSHLSLSNLQLRQEKHFANAHHFSGGSPSPPLGYLLQFILG